MQRMSHQYAEVESALPAAEADDPLRLAVPLHSADRDVAGSGVPGPGPGQAVLDRFFQFEGS